MKYILTIVVFGFITGNLIVFRFIGEMRRDEEGRFFLKNRTIISEVGQT